MRRAQQREQALFLVFESLFSGFELDEAIAHYAEEEEELSDFAVEICKGVTAHREELDAVIAAYSNGWKPERLPKVNLALLRIALYEIKYRDDIPVSVSINEAVELAKTYSGKEDSAFINGILGAYVRGTE